MKKPNLLAYSFLAKPFSNT